MMYYVGCKNSWHEGILRYKLIVRVADHTGDAPMLIWDHECSSLVGMSADAPIIVGQKMEMTLIYMLGLFDLL
nr:replication protein A 70 kDa DNA-binding subunit B-like [Ipomoea batatas]